MSTLGTSKTKKSKAEENGDIQQAFARAMMPTAKPLGVGLI